MTQSTQIDGRQPVTVVISQIVRPGAEEEYESLLTGIGNAALGYEGFHGVEIIRPADHAHPEYVIIFRFDSYDNLKRWQESDERHRWLERITPFTEREAKQKIVSGKEYWLTPPSFPASAPIAPRHKQAVVIWLGIYPLVTILIWLSGPYLSGLPLFLRTLVLTVLLVIIMTYAVMPFLMRHLAGWLYVRK